MDSAENAHLLADPSAKTFKNKTVIIYPRGLDIVWGGDSRYWSKLEDNQPARLRQVCWLEVTASVTAEDKFINPEKKYLLGFKISFESDAFGWGDNHPIYFMIKRGNITKWKKMTLKEKEVDPLDTTRDNTQDITREVDNLNKWEESAEKTSKDDSISFGLYEVWSGKWKGGLNIHHAFVEEVEERK